MDHDTLRLVADIAGALSAAVIAVCTALNNYYAQQHKAATQDGINMARDVRTEVSALSDKVDTQNAANLPPKDSTQ